MSLTLRCCWRTVEHYIDAAPAVDQGETYCNVLTDDGATLRTVNIVCADFHPAVEVHLSER